MTGSGKRASLVFTLILLLILNTMPVQAAAVPPGEPEQIVLSLTGDASEMAVTWCDSGSAADGMVEYGTDPALSGAATAAAVETVAVSGLKYYEAVMTGLASGQQYYYRAGTSAKMSATKSFQTEGGDSSYEFIYLGDVQFTGTSSMASEYGAWAGLVEDAYEDNPSAAFFLQGGDMVNMGQNPEEWQALLTRAEPTFSRVPLLSVPGNHEGNDTSGKPELWSRIFNLPKNGPSGFEEEFYSFDYGDSHILCLNSNIFSNEQLVAGTMTAADFDVIKKWIQDDLQSSTKTWKIVALHHPAYVVVEDPVSAKVLSEWVPIFEDNGVNLVLCGHQHVYMRTFPMFDRERDDSGGIVSVMGNSGSKFYPGAEVSYDASMLENTSTYQTVGVAPDGITVNTYDGAGVLKDTFVAAERAETEHEIHLNYDMASATVSAPASKSSGSAVTVSVSGLASNKKVYSVTAADKNGKTYPVTTITADSSYSFTMPNRSVTVEVIFENAAGGGPGSGTYYNCSIDSGIDPIWSVAAASSGASTEDGGKIKSGETVTVTVSRAAEAYSASLDGLVVNSGSTAVPVTTITTSKGSYNKVKSGKYQFTMPEGNVTISLLASYEPLKIYARESASGSYSLKDTMSIDAMSTYNSGSAYYTGYDRYPTAVIGKAVKHVTLKELLKDCGIELTESSSILLTAIDGASKTFSYDDLYGETRYYYPNIKTGSSAGKRAIEPMLISKGYQERIINLTGGKTIDDMTPDTLAAFRFVYGQTNEQFNSGTASGTYATVGDFLKWTNSIKVTGFKAAGEVVTPPLGGGGVAVAAEAVLGAGGKAAVTLEAAAVKDSLSKALETAKMEKNTPKISISVPMQEGLKSVEVTVPKDILQALAAPEKLLVTISCPFGSTTFDTAALKAMGKQNAGKDVTIVITPVDPEKIKAPGGRELTGDMVEISISTGVKKITEFDGGKIEVEIPFQPDPAKKVNGYYVVWLTEDGNALRMPGSAYNPAAESMKFETPHLSAFAVAYTTNTAVNLFPDVKEDSWYAPYASFVTEKGYFQGTSSTTFGPDAVMTRGMLVTVLGRINNVKPEDFTSSVFKDVETGKWYGGYVQWAYHNGIVNGAGSGTFAPDQPVTREQLATILRNYSIWKNGEGAIALGGGTNPRSYADAPQVSKWAAEGVKYCDKTGWLTGYPDGEFKPAKNATRAEVAKVLNSALQIEK